ncbi:MAG: hypothetical protein K9N49_05720, partial [Candidatus Marinimicrobia bacterium]|nr:hypothetical protein [Candidatus Neomarinimicrobiota bacterium]
SANFPEDGVVDCPFDAIPPPGAVGASWARFPLGVLYILRRAGLPLTMGLAGVLHGNIPGGGMSRSASLTLNLLRALLTANGLWPQPDMQVVDWAQAVETDYIGSPCGNLDQVMIQFARAGMATHYRPAERSVRHIPLGAAGRDLRLVSLDTGTVRPGLEKSTYRIRRAECEALVDLLREPFGIQRLADVRTPEIHAAIQAWLGATHPALGARLRYLYHAQERFPRMLAAWEAGDLETLGAIFRADGHGLRDDYQISGPELETMCDLARAVPGVLGERMLGGGDKGAAGAITRAEVVPALAALIARAYPCAHPAYADRHAVHACAVVEGLTTPAW